MDVTQSIIIEVWHLLRDDLDLQEIIGPHYQGPLSKVPADTAFPFVVHKLDTLDGLDRATRPAVYTVEAWDYGTSMDRTWAIRERLMALLDNARFQVPDQGTARFWHASDVQMPNEDRNVTTIALTFTCRYARSGEVRNILTQKGS